MQVSKKAVLVASFFICLGCKETNQQPAATPQPVVRPNAYIKRVLGTLKCDDLITRLRLELDNNIGLVVDANYLYREIVVDGPTFSSLGRDASYLMVVNKQSNQCTFFQLSSNVAGIYLHEEQGREVHLITRHTNPLIVEVWLEAPRDVGIEVVFK
jgi:hypothetical protein